MYRILAERGDKMKKSFKYLLLITLSLLIITSLVNAQPIPIGTTEQVRPYESNPTVATLTNIAATFGAERDGNLGSSVSFQGTAGMGSGMLFLSQFTNTPSTPFTIGWVDLKIKYKHPGIGDDGYSIGYKTSGSIYDWLQTTVSGPNAKFDKNGNPAVRTWVDLAPTGGGAWTWTDIQSLMIRIIVTRGAPTPGWESFFDLYEVWLTVYESAPPASSTAMSVMPGSSNISIMGLLPGKYFFVDVYVNGLSGSPGLWGYQATIKYDENVVTAVPGQYFSYWPFVTDSGASAINPGVVSVSYYTFGGDTVGFTGTATPLCRIYFQVDSGGATPLDLIDDRVSYISELKPVGATGYVPSLYDGWFSSPRYLSAQGSGPVLIDLASPITTSWHELYPDYCKTWHLTDWEDVSPDNPGVLGPSDQINMTNATGWSYWFHVDEVTITIHWTVKEGEGGPLTEEIGAAEPEDPMLDMPDGSPIGSTWHMIYPTYCQTITITSWDDTDESLDFSPSDQFDFSLGAGDYVLVGTAPTAGSALSAPMSYVGQILYYDANTNGVWDVDESAFDDWDWDGMYVSPGMGGIDVLLVGPAIPDWSTGSYPGLGDTFHDADWSGDWGVGEPAIKDVNLNGVYDPPVTYWAHLDAVSTDIVVSEKPIPPEPPGEPEFPLGISLLLLVAPIVPLTYLWRLRKKVTKQ